MLHHTTKSLAKLRLKLIIIISSLAVPAISFAQNVDTAKVRKGVQKVLRKNGLKDAKFDLKISSTNQTGGQTAYEIANYTANTINIVQGDNYGVVGTVNVNQEKKMSIDDLENLLKEVKEIEKTKTIKDISVVTLSNCNAPSVSTQIIEFMRKNGYKAGSGFAIYNNPVEGILLTLDANDELFIAVGHSN